MKIKTIVCSSIGRKRKINQDNFYIEGMINKKTKPYVFHSFKKSKKEVTYAVCDGMGGENYGEIASLVSVSLLSKYIKKYCALFEKFDDHIKCYVDNANKAICKLTKDSGTDRMGSTLAMLCIAPERESAILANIGDTKIFLFRDNNLKRISEDHNQAQSLLNMGLITEEEARVHKDKSKLTQHLGIFPDELILEPYISDYIQVKIGDIFVICSDGLTDMLSYDEIRGILASKISLKKKTKKLVAEANAQGGNDNITLIVSQAF